MWCGSVESLGCTSETTITLNVNCIRIKIKEIQTDYIPGGCRIKSG